MARKPPRNPDRIGAALLIVWMVVMIIFTILHVSTGAPYKNLFP
jgi:hypothetical protein